MSRFVILLLVAAVASGCKHENPFVCGDGLCVGTEGVECPDCTLEKGESLNVVVDAEDYVTADLGAAFGIDGTEVVSTFLLEKGSTYMFDGWCGAGCETHWVGAYMNVVATISVRAIDAANVTDWLVICKAPDGSLRANDDVDPTSCAGFSHYCDSQLSLSAGIWTCLFGASPFTMTNTSPFGNLTISAE